MKMKNQTVLKKLSWLLAVCFASALALSACKRSEEHPTKEHPATNAPAATNVPPA
jgi:hypothetical protein